MRKYYCSYAGCKALLDHRGYCEVHKDKVLPFANAIRSDLYKDKRWNMLKKKYITSESCCVVCGSTEQLVLDHIVPHRGNIDLFLDEDNLQVLCADHHRSKTAKEVADRRSTTYTI